MSDHPCTCKTDDEFFDDPCEGCLANIDEAIAELGPLTPARIDELVASGELVPLEDLL